MKSKRLLEIASLVPKNSIVLDVGTDHGYVPVYLIEQSKAKYLIGSDISKGSLEKIQAYVARRGLSHKIDSRLGDGLEVIRPFEVDTVIIAGMGGLLIQEILSNSKDVTNSINDFILQPMICAKELREYLNQHNFKIIDNRLLKEDGKYYEVIHAKRGMEYVENDFNYEIPRQFIDERHPLLREYVEYKLKYASKIYRELEDKDSPSASSRKLELACDIENYREVLREIEG